MIFAMVMTVLISTSSTAVHNAGLAARRLEANIIADGLLADLEIQMNRRVAPKVEEGDFERDPYTIHITRSDFIPDTKAGGGTATGLPAAANADIAVMLRSQLPEVAKYLERYDIEVSWIEPTGAESVTRTTFAYDWEAAAVEYADLFQAQDAGGEGTPDLGDPKTLDKGGGGAAR